MHRVYCHLKEKLGAGQNARTSGRLRGLNAIAADLQRKSKHSFWIGAATLSLKAVLQLLIHKSGTNNSGVADFIIKRSERET